MAVGGWMNDGGSMRIERAAGSLGAMRGCRQCGALPPQPIYCFRTRVRLISHSPYSFRGFKTCGVFVYLFIGGTNSETKAFKGAFLILQLKIKHESRSFVFY